MPPEPKHPVSEHAEAVEVSRYRVVVEVALHDRLEPFAGVWHWIVHALAELLLDLLQFAPHTLADRPALHREVPFSVLPAYVRESQKIERLGSSFPSSFPVLFCL